MMVKKKTRSQKETNMKRVWFENILMNYWKLLATSIFKWTGFNSEFLPKYIEQVLFERGTIVFFVDKDDGVEKALPWTLMGGLNIYGQPQEWNVIGLNGFNKRLNYENSVRIRNNFHETPTFEFINYHIKKLVNIDMAIDLNVNALKMPYVFAGDEKQLLTFKNIMKSITDSEPAIYVNSKAVLDNILTVHDLTGVEYQGKNLSELYDYMENRILTYLGLKTVKSDKRERLVVDEANQYNEFKNVNFLSMYEARKSACKEINEMFGLNINVEINPMLKDEGGEDDGILHNDDTRTIERRV